MPFGRKIRGWTKWLPAIAVFFFLPSRATALEYDLGLDLADTFYSQSNYLDRDTGRFERDRRFNLLSVAPNLTLNPEENIQVYMRGELQWKYEPDADPQREDTDDELETFFTDAFLSIGGGPLQLTAGLQPFQFGSSLITAEDAPGLTLIATHDRWTLTGQAARVMANSPMAGLTLGYTPGPFEHLSLFGAWFRDEEDAFARTLPRLSQLLSLTSQGDLYWIGAEAELFAGCARLTLTAAYEFGEITFDHRFGRMQHDVKAYIGLLSPAIPFGGPRPVRLGVGFGGQLRDPSQYRGLPGSGPFRIRQLFRG